MKFLKEQYIPCTVKNVDYLRGFLDCLNSLGDILSFDPSILESARFNDILPDDSKRRDKTEEEIKEIIKEQKESFNVKENEKDDEKHDRDYFNVSCSCGNFHSFKHPIELPKHDLKCEICGKILIFYNNHDDWEYEYDGDIDKMSVEFDNEDDDSDNEEGD